MNVVQETIILGNEFDQELRLKVVEALKTIKANIIDSDWHIAGSQEVELIKFRLNERFLYLESETYIGLSIRGHTEDLKKLTDTLKQ
jgi:hypothetical protein